MRARRVRVVGTSALRRIKNRQVFLEKARKAIGHPIDVISGREEARLIYAGVNRTLPRGTGRRLVIDIGGGSTEAIIGRGLEPIDLESLKIGCVTVSQEHFRDGKLSQRRFERARLAARQEIDPIRLTFRQRGWGSVAGSSGTIRALYDMLREVDPRCTAITRVGLEDLLERFVASGHVQRLPFTSLGVERRPVIAGGLAILVELITLLGIRDMQVADGAMREGVLYDLVGRLTSEDARDQTVRSMQARYHVDIAQASRVEATALALWRQIRHAGAKCNPLAESCLRWAARLHEIGLDVAHSGYHRHGAYLLENADMPGFSAQDQRNLALLVLGCRGGLSKMADFLADRDFVAQILALRLAVLFHHARRAIDAPRIALIVARTIRFGVAKRWLAAHPLTSHLLSVEREAWADLHMPWRASVRGR